MEKRVWNVGDECFIVDMHNDPRCMYMALMPAVVTQVFGDGYSARAMSVSNDLLSRPSTEGQPFATEQEARAWLADYAERITKACATADMKGQRPEWKLPTHAPKQGDVVYTLNLEMKEIMQVTIGIVRIEYGRMEVAYDQSPGNCEASNVRIKEWWHTLEEAEAHVQEKYKGQKFTYITKEALAARIDKEIEQIWIDAEARLKDPSFMEQVKNFSEGFFKQQ